MYRLVKIVAAFAVVSALAACATPDGPEAINDPFEAQNRAIHQVNRGIDRAVLRPGARGYGTAVPGPVRKGVDNFAGNLGLPGMVVNDLLQARVDDALWNASRFLFNTTIGLAGVLDPSTAMGLTERETDFGETLHVWGVGEGVYLELPLLGPSTGRDAVGKAVDMAMNPLNFVLPSDRAGAVAAIGVAAQFGDRYEHSDFIDSVLYDSADSYAQARLLYLQNRRFELSRSQEPDYFDPYEDPYASPHGDSYEDLYVDIYEDPYVE